MTDSTATARPAATVVTALNETGFSAFHLRTIVTTGLGFFTSAYDLFIIGYALALINAEWHPSAAAMGLVGSISLIAVLFGAFLFGAVADRLGRKVIYGLEAFLMVVGALGSAWSGNIVELIVFRFILGLGVGGDYPLSAVIMSEYANREKRGLMVAMTFSAQALGVLAGPAVALALLAAGIDHDIAWRIMLGLGALPTLGVIYLRHTLPESPRWLSRVKGEGQKAAQDVGELLGKGVAIDPIISGCTSRSRNIGKRYSGRRGRGSSLTMRIMATRF